MTLLNQPSEATTKIVVFAYAFPHKKSQDFLIRLALLGITPAAVIGAPYVRLNLPPRSSRISVRHAGVLETEEICRALSFPYIEAPHTWEGIGEYLNSIRPDLGLVAGARILKKPLIDAFKIGIINFHPGLLPESRGLDCWLWDILEGRTLGNTSHLIDSRMDAGLMIERQELVIHPDDSLIDLSLRITESQVAMLESTLKAVLSTDTSQLVRLDTRFPAPGQMTDDQVMLVREAIDQGALASLAAR